MTNAAPAQFGIIPQSYDAGVELSPLLTGKLADLAELIVGELRGAGHLIKSNL